MDRNKWFSLNDGLEPVSEIRATNSGGQSDTALCKSDEDIPERTKVDSGDADRTETLFRSTKSFVSHTNPESAFDDRIIWRVPSGLQLVPHTTNNPVFSTTHSRKPLHHLGFSISGFQRELLDVAHEQYHKVSLTEDCGLCQDRSSVIMVKQHKKEQLRDKKDSTVGGYENTFIENLKGVKTKLFRNKSENLGTHQCINEVYLEDDGHGRKASENVYEEIDNSPPKMLMFIGKSEGFISSPEMSTRYFSSDHHIPYESLSTSFSPIGTGKCWSRNRETARYHYSSTSDVAIDQKLSQCHSFSSDNVVTLHEFGIISPLAKKQQQDSRLIPIGMSADGYLEPVNMRHAIEATMARLEAILLDKEDERKRPATEEKEIALTKQLQMENRSYEKKLIEQSDEWNRRLTNLQHKTTSNERHLFSTIHRLQTQLKDNEEERNAENKELNEDSETTTHKKQYVDEFTTLIGRSSSDRSQCDDLIQSLRRALNEMQQRLKSTERQMKSDQERWREEKKKVITYQKQLQLNYIQILQRNKNLREEISQLTLELERHHIRHISGASLTDST